MANALLEVQCSSEKWGFCSKGWTSNANYSVKKTTLLLFINHRAVESTTIKKAVEQTYSMFLPKGGHPFVYLSLEVDPKRVDVNVHPTKREVHFLNEDEVVDLICEEIKARLSTVDTSRTFMTQSLLPGVKVPTISLGSVNPQAKGPRILDQAHMRSADPASTPASVPRTTASQKPYESNLVRTDSRARKITTMFQPANTSQRIPRESSGAPPSHKEANDPEAHLAHEARETHTEDAMEYTYTDREPTVCRLGSIRDLRADVREATHNNFTDVIATHTFIGVVDHARRLAAIQSRTKLYLVDYGLISFEFFYQLGLTNFGNFGLIRLDPPLSLRSLLVIAADIEKEKSTSPDRVQIDWSEAGTVVAEQLIGRREMIAEYFSLEISADGELLSLPLLLKGYLPSMAKLPGFLLRLGPFVEWNDEKQCFQTFLKELARWHVPEAIPSFTSPITSSGQDWTAESPEISARQDEISHTLENVLFPAFKFRLIGLKSMLKGAVEVANLKGLYRVFERC